MQFVAYLSYHHDFSWLQRLDCVELLAFSGKAYPSFNPQPLDIITDRNE